MGNIIQVNPERIEQHGKDIDSNITPELEKVGSETLGGDGVYNLEGGSFSVTCTAASVTYPGAIQFAFQDLRTHLEMLKHFGEGIATTAKNYTAAEQASVVSS
ncbi:hypothetical protein J4573_44925 [Actinomadura barringtoniae]|uniref:Uncharacterized protein n=1 Tax=Actinomadura barringtoniae TaxID=1427535 RepID=A0A939T5Y4_9ACTN|nr:hypothetical protein [Actinomadura barringtoniae]MBO2454296.1 hypothetical protein [Actinomadura barringtoniae]